MPERRLKAVPDAAPAFLPYGRQEIGDADVEAVVEALASGWLTTGPKVPNSSAPFPAIAAPPRGSRSIPAPPRCMQRCGRSGCGPATR
jgi:hypothetical protein